MIGSRHLRLGVAIVAVTLIGAIAASRPVLDPDDWRHYRSRFITTDGRVRDTGNGGISHSESQGYAMLLAVAYGDAIQFERLWQWTRRHLQIREDHLFAWKWDPAAADPVADRNSAADGDLLIALALARGASRWDVPSYRDAARAIARDVLDHLVREVGARTVLLPGPYGFVHDQSVTVNPSYWLFPAFAELDRLLPSPEWQRLTASGLELLREARFGEWGLAPDWLALGQGALAPSPRHEPVFGYNAVRVPLHLIWGGIDDRDLLEPYLAYADAFRGTPPATIDLGNGRGSPETVSTGARAILALTRWAVDGIKPRWPDLEPEADYFSSSLWMLSKLAYAERSTV